MIAVDPLSFNAHGRSLFHDFALQNEWPRALNIESPFVGREQQFVVAGVVVTALCTFHDNDFDYWKIIDKDDTQ